MMRILVVEDQPRNIRLIEQILLDISDEIEVVKAASGMEAISKARETEFVLVLMDIALPDMDGIQTTSWLKEYPQFREVPFIAVTAYATAREKENIRQVFDYYISKPIDEDLLVEIVQEVLSRR
ncbi:MAG: response regulator [Clostridia bacterium]|nr:response regulator [Clostridia bacterium]